MRHKPTLNQPTNQRTVIDRITPSILQLVKTAWIFAVHGFPTINTEVYKRDPPIFFSWNMLRKDTIKIINRVLFSLFVHLNLIRCILNFIQMLHHLNQGPLFAFNSQTCSIYYGSADNVSAVIKSMLQKLF